MTLPLRAPSPRLRWARCVLTATPSPAPTALTPVGIRPGFRSDLRGDARHRIGVPPLSARVFPAALALGLAACVEPGAEYDDFVARCEARQTSACTPPIVYDPEVCTRPEPSEVEGLSLFTVSLTLAKERPVLYRLETTAVVEGEGLRVTHAARPLDKVDGETPVGEGFTVDYLVAADGSFTATMPETITPAAANPITGGDVTTQLVLTGSMCSTRRPEAPEGGVDFLCGTLTADITRPVRLSTTGTFTNQRPRPGEPWPSAVLDCEGTTVAPPAAPGAQ